MNAKGSDVMCAHLKPSGCHLTSKRKGITYIALRLLPTAAASAQYCLARSLVIKCQIGLEQEFTCTHLSSQSSPTRRSFVRHFVTAMFISRLIFLPFFNVLLLVCAAGTRLLKVFVFF